MVYNSIFSGSVGGGPGYVAQSTAPDDTATLWIDTGNDNIMKFYDESTSSWIPVTGVWG